MLLAGLRLRLIVVLQPDAPRAFRKAGIGGVVLAPLGHELLEVTAALPPHPSRAGDLSITPPFDGREGKLTVGKAS